MQNTIVILLKYKQVTTNEQIAFFLVSIYSSKQRRPKTTIYWGRPNGQISSVKDPPQLKGLWSTDIGLQKIIWQQTVTVQLHSHTWWPKFEFQTYRRLLLLRRLLDVICLSVCTVLALLRCWEINSEMLSKFRWLISHSTSLQVYSLQAAVGLTVMSVQILLITK